MTQVAIGQDARRTAAAVPQMRGLLARVRHHFEIRRALSHVASLDDRMLRDIGIERSQVESAVRGRMDWR